MRNLDLTEMESIQGGGWGCALSIAGGIAAFGGLATLTAASGGAAIAFAVIGWNAAAASIVYSC